MRHMVVCLLLGAVLVVSGCKRDAEPAPKQAVRAPAASLVLKLTPEAIKAGELELETVEPRPYRTSLRVSGVVKPNPNRLVDVSALIGGRVIASGRVRSSRG